MNLGLGQSQLKARINREDVGLIDVHAHACGIHIYNLMKNQYPTTQDARDLVLKVGLYRVDNIVVTPMPTPLYYDFQGYIQRKYFASGIESFPFEIYNQSLLHDVEIFGGKVLIPFMSIHPTEKIDDQIRFLENNEARIYGLKLHTYTTNTYATDLIGSPFMDYLAKYNLPLLVHSRSKRDITNAIHILNLAEHYPKIRICIAHLADFDRDIITHINNCPNLYIDTSPFLSMCKYANERNFDQVSEKLFDTDYGNPVKCLVDINAAIPGRLLWGTDEPWTTTAAFDYAQERGVLDKLVKSGNDDVCQAITHQNTINFLFGE